MTTSAHHAQGSRRITLARLLFCVCLLAAPRAVRAQDPSLTYVTITTAHFHVSFTRPLEPLARRVAAHAERAYAQLSAEMHPPRGPIDILVSDDADYSNGSAITFPTNRILVYATPPVNESALRYTTDWAQMVVTHELAHIFHLDRSRGLWRYGQYIFGRSPFLFPNLYQPSWVIEGLAVYEESRLSGQGRIEGAEHTLITRAAALDHAFPRIGDASLALPKFPLGEGAYAYGSLFFNYLATTRGEDKVRTFVESSAVQLIPYLIDVPAKHAFGTTLNKAWGEWRQSIEKTLPPAPTLPLPGWKELTTDGLDASFPRWLGDSSLTYTGTGGKESYAAYTIDLDGTRKRMGRRNSASPTVRLNDGSLLFAQGEYVSPYTYRSDLYVERDGTRDRLTHGQRLFGPDVRADGAIVAAQVVAGASRIVRVSRDGKTITPVTRVAFDTLWNEPRWSAQGDRLVAVRWVRGGISQIVVIDTLGGNEMIIASGRALAAAPAWLPNDRGIIYSLAPGHTNDLYVRYLGGSPDSGATVRLTRSDAGIFEPQLRSSGALAAVTLRGDGYHLGVGQCCASAEATTAVLDTTSDPRLPALASDTSPATPYSAFRQMLPRYWVPLAELGIDNDTYRLGGYTEAHDILRRHSLYAELLVPTDNSGLNAGARYQYNGFGLPVMTLSAVQDWIFYRNVVSRDSPPRKLGEVRRRVRDADLLATFLRQRVRSSFNASIGAGYERREYVSLPDSLLPLVDSAGRFSPAGFPRFTASAGYAAYVNPPFSFSAEDGFTVAATARERMKSGFNATGGPSLSVVAAVTGYKSINLPGYAHHVLAVRGSAGWADTKASGYYEVGGTSGGTFQVFPGYTVGEGRQTFPVRGFAPGSLIGIRALSGSAEYRAPLSLSRLTLGTLPGFVQRTSITVFGDYGQAWCPSTALGREVCVNPSTEVRADIGSVGAELTFSAGVLSWDSPYRFRLGLAVPVRNGQALGQKRVSVYFTSGISF